ncbi:hypothetical protein TNCT_54631 [Trichonephila clavata]|uniref:Uncharacterized protein n=1 Tax=Trichonephila clavata TaxID=2740835 RepID=A0A8X6FJ11_TRICU|nr:hypothetical protein TNCT_54631 [Trichonephila clavata]
MKEMSNRRELLEKLSKISEECSDIESDATNSELTSEDDADYIQSETLKIAMKSRSPTMKMKVSSICPGKGVGC